MEARIQEVAALLEEEIAHYEKLVAALTKEAEDLRRGSPEELLESVKAAGAQIEAITRIHAEVRGKMAELSGSPDNRDGESPFGSLRRLLPPAECRRFQRYHDALDKLKNWALQINSRNKTFIREALAHFESLFSLFNPANEASPAYAAGGKKKPAARIPVSLDRKV
jgi:flagellar biosynthesis/type III secretory pathway chaperone